MNKIISIVLLLATTFIHASSDCIEPKNTEYFSKEYISEYLFAPNWDDLCYELDSIAEAKLCTAEANKWVNWHECKTVQSH
jgi:hypothetical protein